MPAFPLSAEAVRWAVNVAILQAHRLGEPRVLELSADHLRQLRRVAEPRDFDTPLAYRGLRIAETQGSAGRVLAWDRARETQTVQAIDWSRPA